MHHDDDEEDTTNWNDGTTGQIPAMAMAVPAFACTTIMSLDERVAQLFRSTNNKVHEEEEEGGPHNDHSDGSIFVFVLYSFGVIVVVISSLA
eukprot:scaffold4682_cov145-Amphora_coffeaeformis.AAC.2